MSDQTNNDQDGVKDGWEAVDQALRRELGDTVHRSWIAPLELGDLDAGKLTLHASSRFVRDWVRSNYSDRILAHCKSQIQGVLAVDVVARPKSATAKPARTLGDGAALAAQPAAQIGRGFPAADLSVEQDNDISAPLDQRLTFDSYVVGTPNELAYAAARRVAENPSVTFNPLFLYSGVGLGKTHLMHSIAWYIRQNQPERKVVYMTAEQYMFKFVRAIREKDTVAFKESFRDVDVLMVDDIQFISGRESTQEEFFHTFNSLVDRNRQVIISADKSPTELEGMEDRLRSRLGWGLVADIHPTTYELRLGILERKALTQDVLIPRPVMEFLAQRITSNVRELEGAFNRLVAHSSLMGRPITLDTTEDLLSDVLRAHDKRVTIEDIQRKVAEHFNIRLSDMHSPRRARAIARPRQIAMYLSKVLTNRSLPEIGRKFGGRDHTTVMHAVRKVEELCGQDRSFQEDVALLEKSLRE